MKIHSFKSVISSLWRTMQLPEDLIHGKAIVSMHGYEHLYIENFKGIVSYTETEIKVLTRDRKICISGKRLKIDSYTKEEIEISGYIMKLEYI